MIRCLYRLLPLDVIVGKYVFFGEEVGSAVRCRAYEHIDELLDGWNLWEEAYAKRGYKTLNLDEFTVDSHLENLLYKKRDKFEEPVYHSKLFRERNPGIASKP